MPCEQIQGAAAGLASLASADPERVAAFAHARGCAACAAALRQGKQLLALLDLAAPSLATEPATLRRVAAEIHQELAADSARLGGWRAVGPAVVGVLGAWLLPLAGGLRLRGRAEAMASLAMAVAAAAGTAGALVLGGVALAVPPLASLVCSLLAAQAGPLNAAHGLECALFELGPAAIPVLALLWTAHRQRAQVPAAMLAAAAGGGAVAGQAALVVTCTVMPSSSHLLAFHSGPVLVAMSAAAAFATWRARNRAV